VCDRCREMAPPAPQGGIRPPSRLPGSRRARSRSRRRA
jgi:hypothetical protein